MKPMTEEKCLVCNLAVVDELTCTRCPRQCHISCTIGCRVNNKGTRQMIKNGEFLCQVCVISRRDELTISAMQQNQHLHKQSQIDFPLPESYTTTVNTDVEEESEPMEEQVEVNGSAADGVPPAVADGSTIVGGPPAAANSSAVDAVPHRVGGAGRLEDLGSRHGETPLMPEDVATIHSDCGMKAKKLLSVLNNMLTIPKHASTLLIGDSLAHYINKREVDQESDTLRVRSIGGLCVIATVKALGELDRSYGNFKRIIYSLGTNDLLHRAKHCFEERPKYYKALEDLSARVFPNATIHIVVPYVGMKNIPKSEIMEQIKLVKESCHKIKVHVPPALIRMTDGGGVHPDKEGKVILTIFYKKRFFPHRPRSFNKNSGKRRPDINYAQAADPEPRNSIAYSAETRDRFHVPPQQPPHIVQQPSYPVLPERQNQPARSQWNSRSDQVVWDIADVLAQMMTQRRCEPTYTMNNPWK